MSKGYASAVFDGDKIIFEGHGFVGPECDKFLAFLEEDLGPMDKKVHKPEYRQKEVRHEKRKHTVRA